MTVRVKRIFAEEWARILEGLRGARALHYGDLYRDGTKCLGPEDDVAKPENAEKRITDLWVEYDNFKKSVNARHDQMREEMFKDRLRIDDTVAIQQALVKEGSDNNRRLNACERAVEVIRACSMQPRSQAEAIDHIEEKRLRKANENLEALCTAYQRTAERHQNFTALARAQVEVLRLRLRQNGITDSLPK